ncbi:MAG: lycopene beta-cyclase CrtY [Novosphingobium sp.]
MSGRNIDLAILGGGLAGGLIALALAKLRPELRLLLIERGETFGVNHLWSCFASDVAPSDEWLIDPLIAGRWPGYDVHFPGHSRRLATGYRSLASERLDAALRAALPAEALMPGVEAGAAGHRKVLLADGTEITAGAVIDARGLAGMPHMTGGWQKFAGQMLRLTRPHALDRPVVMDARVEQHDGYRFVYCLPFGPAEVFVEDTYYSDSAALDLPLLRARIAAYARERGWEIEAVTREECGVLPVIAEGDFAAFWPEHDEQTARAGARAALVHPLTSYSLPIAVRFALHIARLRDLSGPTLARASRAWAQAHWQQGRLYRLLARMLFGAAAPEERLRVLERFYRLPEPLIERFYAERSTRADGVRILAGRPPVPVLAALASLSGRGRPLAGLDGHLLGAAA